MCRPGTPGPQQALGDLWLTWRVPWERMFAPNLRGFGEQPELPGGGLGPGSTESQGGLPHVRPLAGQLGPSSLRQD